MMYKFDQSTNFADDEQLEMPSNLGCNQIVDLFRFGTESSCKMPINWLEQ